MTIVNPHIDALKRLFEGHLAVQVARRYGGVEAEVQRYVLNNGGKHVRPLLCLLTAEAVGGDVTPALGAATALELVHTYSLVHDDLPCMDDDDTRRGKATAHKAFSEAQALLAGDALLTDAFALLAGSGSDAEEQLLASSRRLAMIRELARAAGSQGMVLGQYLDLHWTSRKGAGLAELNRIHRHKTGDLLGASAAMGAIAGGAPADIVDHCRRFGQLLGIAFQVLDDVLDESAATGKSPGKDRQAGKLTYLALMSPEEARAEAAAYTRQAIESVQGLKSSLTLIDFILSLLGRTH